MSLGLLEKSTHILVSSIKYRHRFQKAGEDHPKGLFGTEAKKVHQHTN